MESVNRNKIWLHVLGWLIFFTTPFFFSPGPIFGNLMHVDTIVSSLFRNLVLMALFYGNLFYLTPVLLKNKGIVFFISLMFFLVVGVTFFNWWVHDFFTGSFEFPPNRMPPPDHDGFRPPRGPGPPGIRFMFGGPFFSGFLLTVIIATMSTLIVTWEGWTKARETEQERTLQKVASELAVLKLQISPHFLFNTLNNIRWLVRSKSDQAEEAVMKLSQLLRYILYQTDHDRVPLGKEIDHLKDFISLQQMRLTQNESMSFVCEVDKPDQDIVPLLFIPLIENFFKYGDFNSAFKNQITLEAKDGRLVFQTENAIAEPTADVEGESGIGLTNVKKRLALHYPGKSLLTFAKEGGLFKVRLEILLT